MAPPSERQGQVMVLVLTRICCQAGARSQTSDPEEASMLHVGHTNFRTEKQGATAVEQAAEIVSALAFGEEAHVSDIIVALEIVAADDEGCIVLDTDAAAEGWPQIEPGHLVDAASALKQMGWRVMSIEGGLVVLLPGEVAA